MSEETTLKLTVTREEIKLAMDELMAAERHFSKSDDPEQRVFAEKILQPACKALVIVWAQANGCEAEVTEVVHVEEDLIC